MGARALRSRLFPLGRAWVWGFPYPGVRFGVGARLRPGMGIPIPSDDNGPFEDPGGGPRGSGMTKSENKGDQGDTRIDSHSLCPRWGQRIFKRPRGNRGGGWGGRAFYFILF